MSMPKFEYKFNAIQNASFQANIRSSTEKFKQFCRETELIQIASGEHSCYWMLENLIPNDDLYNDVIMEINNDYPVIGSELGFGYKSLTKQSQLNHIKTIGSAKFIEIINCPKLGKKYSHQCFNDSWGLAYFLNDENFLKAHDIQKIFEIVNNLNKETITPATVSFCSALMLSHCSVNALNRPSNYRINKGLDILHLPKYLLQDIQFLKTQKNHMLLDICLSIFKFCEIDSGINDDRNEYAHYDVRMELVGDLFDDDYYLTFVNKFWDLSNIKVKQQVTENTIINIFNETLNQNKNIYNLALIRFKNIINQEIVEPENFVKNLYSCFELNNQFEFLKRCLNDPDVSISQLLLKFNNSLNEENSDSTIKNIELFYRDLENMKMLSITEQKSVTQFKKMLCLIIEKNKLAQHLTTIV